MLQVRTNRAFGPVSGESEDAGGVVERYPSGRARREDWLACESAMRLLPPPLFAARSSAVKRAGNDRLVADTSLGAGHPLVGLANAVGSEDEPPATPPSGLREHIRA
jgi:hypothetical protein